MKLYAYCLCTDLEMFEKPVSGVAGTAVRLLKIEDICLVVSDCEAVPATQENMLAHAAVVRSVFEQTTTVPFRFGTLVSEEQLRSFITGHKAALANKFAHLRGRVEMDLKISWQRSKTAPPKQPEPAAGPGTAFLREKRRELLGDDETRAQGSELSSMLREELGELIKDEGMSLRPSETAVLAKVYHLVEGSKIQEYRKKIAAVQQKRPELGLEVSGPWPPYSFANIDLEFKS